MLVCGSALAGANNRETRPFLEEKVHDRKVPSVAMCLKSSQGLKYCLGDGYDLYLGEFRHCRDEVVADCLAVLDEDRSEWHIAFAAASVQYCSQYGKCHLAV